MKLLTYHGPSHYFFEVPGLFKIAGGESHLVDDHVADRLIAANPDEPLTALPAPKRDTRPQRSQPEARKGEGQPTANEPEKE